MLPDLPFSIGGVEMEKEKLKKQNRLVMILLVILVVMGLAIHQYFNYALKPVDRTSHTQVTVMIPQGATDDQVAKILKQNRLVRSSYVFSYYLQTHKTSGVKAGRFTLDRSLSIPQIANQLQQSRAAKRHWAVAVGLIVLYTISD